jgi:hypothetical protein
VSPLIRVATTGAGSVLLRPFPRRAVSVPPIRARGKSVVAQRKSADSPGSIYPRCCSGKEFRPALDRDAPSGPRRRRVDLAGPGRDLQEGAPARERACRRGRSARAAAHRPARRARADAADRPQGSAPAPASRGALAAAALSGRSLNVGPGRGKHPGVRLGTRPPGTVASQDETRSRHRGRHRMSIPRILGTPDLWRNAGLRLGSKPGTPRVGLEAACKSSGFQRRGGTGVGTVRSRLTRFGSEIRPKSPRHGPSLEVIACA